MEVAAKSLYSVLPIEAQALQIEVEEIDFEVCQSSMVHHIEAVVDNLN